MEKYRKAFGEALVANSQSIARAMLEDGSIDDKKFLEVFMEHLYLFLHIADRMSYSVITEQKRDDIMAEISGSSIRVAVEITCGHWPHELKAKILDECLDNYNSAITEFSQYEHVLGDSSTADKDTLLWGFCKNISKISDCETNLGAIIGHQGVILVALRNIDIKSHLERLR